MPERPGQTKNIPVIKAPDRVGTLKESNDSHQLKRATPKGLAADVTAALGWRGRCFLVKIAARMPQNRNGLSRAEYLRFRAPYVPDQPKIVFVLESPPKSGLYFYNPEGKVSEPLFSAMMKDVIELKPESKDQGLREFASRGFLLIDATYSPVNHDHLSLRERNKRILDDLPTLVDELHRYGGPDTGVVLVKANVCALLQPILTARGFNIQNRGRVIPFPSTGQQCKFRQAIRQVLGSTL